MTILQTKLQCELEEFRKMYPLTKVLQENDELVYIFKTFYNAAKATSEANFLIHRLGLNLVAVHSGSNSFFVVKRGDVEV